jgi:hypothetical protein
MGPIVRLFLFIVLACGVAFADVGYDTDWEDHFIDAVGAQTVSGTIAGNANRVLYVAHFIDSNTANDSTGCSWNTTETMTEIDERNAGSGFIQVTVYRRTNPTATTANVSCTHTDTNSTGIWALSVYNVDQISPTSGIDGDLGGGVSISNRTMTTVAGDMMVSICAIGQTNTSATAAQSETERLDLEFNENARLAWAGSKIASGTMTTSGCDWTNNANFGHSALVINELDAGVPATSGIFRSTIIR